MDKTKLEKAYTEAITQLRENPRMVWTRNNFFLLSQTGLLAFTLNITSQQDKGIRILACCAGIFLAIIWLLVNMAGRTYFNDWRSIVIEYEDELFGKDEGPLARAQAKGQGSHRTLKSITKLLLVLSIGFGVIWLVLLVYYIVLAIRS